MKTLTSRLLLATSLTALTAPAFAAGGMAVMEIGTHDLGLAGAGYAARADDAATAVTNPAGMTRLKGDDLVLGTQLLYGNMEFSPDGNSTHTGGGGRNAVGWVPGVSTFYVHSFSDDVKFGFGFYNNFGLAADWSNSWSGRYYGQEATLAGITLAPSLAFKLNEQWSLGIGVNAMYGIVDVTAGVNNLLPAEGDGTLEYDDHDWGYSGTVGVLYEASPTTRFGVTYTSETELEFSKQPKFSNLGPGLSAVLNATGMDTATLDIGMTVPQAVMSSVYYGINNQWAILGNVGWQDWSEFGEIAVAVDSNPPKSLTTTSNFDDTWHAAIGTEYRYSDTWMFTSGVAYDSSMVSSSDRSVTLPMDASWALGFGAKYQINKDFDVSLGYELKWLGDVPVDQTRGPLAGRISGEYNNMALNFFSASFHWRF